MLQDLRQVVTNIVGNIHRYTPADSPVEVSMGVLPASISPESLSRMPSNEQSLRHLVEAIEVGQSMQVGMNYAIVRFSDHGPGVPADARSKIFERFYTADPSRARQKGGTALGMAIAQSVVKAHHGFICASGSDGTGLTLTVVLPVAPVEPRPLAQTSDERKGDKRGAGQKSNDANAAKRHDLTIIGARDGTYPTSCAKLYLWFVIGGRVFSFPEGMWIT